MTSLFPVGCLVHYNLEENCADIRGIAVLGYKAQIKKCTKIVGRPFGRGRLIKKEAHQWLVQALDHNDDPLTLASEGPFILRLIKRTDLPAPLGLSFY